MPQARTISRAELARLAGVSKPAVTQCATRGSLKPARIRDRLDLDHPAVLAYLERHDVKAPPAERAKKASKRSAVGTGKAKRTGKKRSSKAPSVRRTKAKRTGKGRKPAPPEAFIVDPNLDVDTYLDMPLRRIADEYGTMTAFRDLLSARKDLEVIREKTIANQESEGRLISRELVEAHVFGALEKLARRLLGNVPKTLSRRLYAAAKSGTPIEDSEQVVSETIGSEIKPTRDAVARVLRKALTNAGSS